MLLDTHVLLWFLNNDDQLPITVKNQIEEADQVYVSMISIFEIGIKLNIGKLTLDYQFSDLTKLLENLKIKVLNISFSDIEIYINLPLYHRDPFDRILIAQAINNHLILVSKDQSFDNYSITTLWE